MYNFVYLCLFVFASLVIGRPVFISVYVFRYFDVCLSLCVPVSHVSTCLVSVHNFKLYVFVGLFFVYL